MSAKRVLIVDDEASLRTALFRALDRRGFLVTTASTKKEAESLVVGDRHLDMALIDLRLPDGDGLELLSFLKKISPKTQIIILTGFGSIDLAIEATQKGAFHFVTKPFNLDEILSLISKAINQVALEQENQQLKSALKSKYQFDNIIGQSEVMQNLLNLVGKVADSDSTVLISGESGTGKELVAKALHYNSCRKDRPFIPINCGAIPGELLESELFGHVKGSFTGAVNNRVGRFELAEGGTLFLDEIGDMSLHLQVKLLRVLQERTFEPVGSSKTQTADVRIVAATNVNLEDAVEQGKFREDLFYRLNVIPLQIPALRDRAGDLLLLLDHFIQKFNQTRGRTLTGVSDEALQILLSYQWPGNIRELENLIERISILKGEGLIEIEDLPDKFNKIQTQQSLDSKLQIPGEGLDFNSAVDAYENALILKALEKTGWNRNQAALLLRLNRTTLVEKIKKKGLRPPDLNM